MIHESLISSLARPEVGFAGAHDMATRLPAVHWFGRVFRVFPTSLGVSRSERLVWVFRAETREIDYRQKF